jgi:tetratricopeptide (TPR) repeat protein
LTAVNEAESRRSHRSGRQGVGVVHAFGPVAAAPLEDPIEELIRRSRRCRHKGDARRALVLLREACARDEWRARTFTLLGVLLRDMGRHDDAVTALEHARWLRHRAGEEGRAAATARLLVNLRRMAA